MLRALAERSGVTVYVAELDRLAAETLVLGGFELVQVGTPRDRPVDRDLYAVFLGQRGDFLSASEISRHRLFDDDVDVTLSALKRDLGLSVVLAENIGVVGVKLVEHLLVVVIDRGFREGGDVL